MIDLHMHSRLSDDGEFTPTELVEKCAGAGIRVMSVTDHNCARANAEAERAARDRGLCYITGIEIDCVYDDTAFHVLGYGIDAESPDFERIEQNIAEQEAEASLVRLVKTQALGFRVTEEDMRTLATEHPGVWTGELFAELLLTQPDYADDPRLLPYRPGGARGDNPYVNFYWDYYAEGKPCHARMRYPEMGKIASIIHKNNGVAVLAHPGVNLRGKEHMLDGVLASGLDGIEAFSSYHTTEQADGFYREAVKRGLGVSCGSDFHGKTKPSVSLGGHGQFLAAQESDRKLLTARLNLLIARTTGDGFIMSKSVNK